MSSPRAIYSYSLSFGISLGFRCISDSRVKLFSALAVQIFLALQNLQALAEGTNSPSPLNAFSA